MKFNGGEFRPLSSALSVDSAVDMLVGEGGAVISTEEVPSGVCTLSAALTHDPALAGADGGLVKKGAGTLALSGANTYTGPAVVEEGVLQALNDASLPTVTEVRYGAVLDLGGSARTVGGIAGGGVVRNGTLVLAGMMQVSAGVPFLDCNLATVKGAAIDFGCTDGDPVPYGKKLLVAQISGNAVGELRLKARNAGCDCALDVSVEDGNVYVTTKGNGTRIVFR